MAPKSLSERTADVLYNQIVIERTMTPGDKLPNENELAESLGVSRATLREAIRSLEAQGVLEVFRGKGTFIAADVWDSDVDLKGLDRARVRLKDLFEMRLMFEPKCIALACTRASEEEIERILTQGAQVIDAIMAEDPVWGDLDQTFHTLVSKASHNEFMIRLFPIINSAVHGTLAIANNLDVLKDLTIADNTQIMDFLSRRDPKGSAGAMDLHMRHVINALGLDK